MRSGPQARPLLMLHQFFRREFAMKGRLRNHGFTMMELVVVLAVIAILASLITPVITSYVDRAKIAKAQSDVRNITTAIVQFNTDTHRFPVRGPDNVDYLFLSGYGDDADNIWAGPSTN